MEKRYMIPCETGASDRESIQAAVNEAARTDMRTVVLAPKADGKPWQLDGPVLLPAYVTVILEGAQVQSQGIAFQNSNCDDPATYCLGGEQAGIYLIGTKGAKIAGAVKLYNVNDYGIKNIAFVSGTGVELTHARNGKLQDLTFRGTTWGIRLGESCISNLLTDITAETEKEAVLWEAKDSAIWGRSTEICHSSLSRLQATTQGAPAVAIRPGPVTVSNLFLRDITAEGGVALELGDAGSSEMRDISARGIVTKGLTATVTGQCDGIYLGNLSGQQPRIAEGATRVFIDPMGGAVELPRKLEETQRDYVTANDPAWFGRTDAETIQNALHAAAKQGLTLVIPRHNDRTGENRWDIDRTILLPADSTLVLLDAHLRQTDFTYNNLFRNAPEADNIRVIGVGSATLDTGKPNGLKVKNAGTMGFGPIEDNATILLQDVDTFEIRGLHVNQSRWYSLCCTGCTEGYVADLHLYAPPVFPDLGGVLLRSGCRDILVENITGLSGEDMILLNGTDGTAPVARIHVRNILANPSRCVLVHMVGNCRDILVESVLDNSVPEQKKRPRCAIRVGDPGGAVQGITIQDANGRGFTVVELGGTAQDVTVSNIHGFGTASCALQTYSPDEVIEFVMIGISESVCKATWNGRTVLKDVRASGIFFRCIQGSAYMRGTATSIITDKRKFVGSLLELYCVQAENVVMDQVLGGRIGTGITMTGEGAVEVKNMTYELCGREETLCAAGCTLTVNGQVSPTTENLSL